MDQYATKLKLLEEQRAVLREQFRHVKDRAERLRVLLRLAEVGQQINDLQESGPES